MARSASVPFLCAWLLAACAASGCAMKARPGAGAGFVPMDGMSRMADLPFHQAWYKDGVDWTAYTELLVAPVNTEHIERLDWWKSMGRGRRLDQDLPALAAYTREAFQRAFSNDPRRRFRVLEDPAAAGPHTVTLELALTEVIPSKITLNAIGYVPLIGSAARVLRGASARSTVAFEARMRDAATGEALALFADREAEKFAPVNVKDLTWYGHAHGIITRWAAQFVQVANRKPGERIKDSRPFTLKPW